MLGSLAFSFIPYKKSFTILRTITETFAVSSDDQVKAYIKKIMSQLNKWMVGGKISKMVVVITSKDTGEHVERWQFDVSSDLPLSNSHLSGACTWQTNYASGPNFWQGFQNKVIQESG
jgi:mitotic spindle assembly checkpoint protein MAD2